MGERSYYDDKGNLVWENIVDYAPTINENDDMQKTRNNGYTLERTFRHIGQIPAEAFHRWAKQNSYYEMDKVQRNIAVRNYLKDNPQFATVESLVTHNVNDGHIIVK